MVPCLLFPITIPTRNTGFLLCFFFSSQTKIIMSWISLTHPFIFFWYQGCALPLPSPNLYKLLQQPPDWSAHHWISSPQPLLNATVMESFLTCLLLTWMLPSKAFNNYFMLTEWRTRLINSLTKFSCRVGSRMVARIRFQSWSLGSSVVKSSMSVEGLLMSRKGQVQRGNITANIWAQRTTSQSRWKQWNHSRDAKDYKDKK